MKNTIKKEIPKFINEEEERKFWATHNSEEYIDWSKSNTIMLPKLKPTLKTISIRLPETIIEEIKLLANKRDVPYQSLMKIFLAERVEQEFQK
jgi:predicted DNA binding CopG/RHH family protein